MFYTRNQHSNNRERALLYSTSVSTLFPGSSQGTSKRGPWDEVVSSGPWIEGGLYQADEAYTCP